MTLIFGLSGYSGTGKDEVAKLLKLRHGFQRVAFADILKQFVQAIDPVLATFDSEGNVNGATRPSTVLAWKTEGYLKNRTSYREMLQRTGVAAREILNEDVWVDPVIAYIRHLTSEGTSVAVTDVRFENEAKALKTLGGQLIRVTREGYGPANDHVSETAHETFNFDAQIHNDVGRTALGSAVTDLVRSFDQD